jgi:N-acetylated-alpha-linked acidic dipeptidase
MAHRASVASQPGAANHLGYSASAWQRQASLEKRFRAAISADSISAHHAVVTRRPHMAGTEGSRVVAQSIVTMLERAGLDVEVLEYQAYLSAPREISVALVARVSEVLRVSEPPSSRDADTENPDLGPGFVAYSASGDVTAPVVYANYGLPADYAQLQARGIDVRGKLVIVRYGRSHRAVKLYTAQQAGAAGVIIYSDPADDGFIRGETWPNGYWRTSELLQRGNGKYSWYWHGDPLTPGEPAVANARRLDSSTAPTLPRIPAAVLSWGEARKILERLDGPVVPPSFQGALPFAYHVGGGAVRARLHVRMDDGLRTIRNVVARVPGARLADRGVLLGTHHDAWTFGGVDPGTGTAVMLEVARALGALRRTGWRPERTISLAFWDAEEFGLVGSTEYAEQKRRELRNGTICYINTDLYTNGRLDAGGTPSLRDVIADVTKDVSDANGRGSLYDAWRADEWSRQTPERRRRGMRSFEVELKALGSGADFVPFQDYLGLPTLSLEFNATGGYSYGAYHSNYDTRFFATHIADPGFRRGADLARLIGSVALRLGEAEILPFRFSHYTKRLAQYVETASTWAVDDTGATILPLNLGSVRAAVARAAEQAALLDRKIDDQLASGRVSPARVAALNDTLARLEQRLIDESAPAEKRWYRHVVYGWDIYSLYDGQPFPGLAEAIRRRDASGAQKEIARINGAVKRLSEGLRAAMSLVDAGNH